MAFGLDYVTGPPINDMKAAGVTFVCRYLSEVNSQTQVKLLTPNEAKALSSAGIAIVSNYEWYANRSLEGFAAGAWDAQLAASQHANCGGPSSRPIYFSVDVDVDGARVADYFKGIASVIGKARTGVYGSFRVLQYLFNAGLISWGWQTYAWSGGQWEGRAHIQQYQNSMKLGGASVDYNRSIKSDFGQWLVGGHTMSGVPLGWHDNGTVLYSPSHIQGGPDVPVTGPFRDYILANAWRPSDRMIEVGHHVNTLQYADTSLGGGYIQHSIWSMLLMPDNGGGKVIYAWTGVESMAVRRLYEEALVHIAELGAEIAKLQQPVLDPAKVKDRLTAIGLASSNGNTAIQGLVTQAIV